MCDREPCDIPCNQILNCGHPCIGYCGEPCPPQCRICDKKELTEDFFLLGNEEDPDSRFILLPDCSHAIEAEGLDHYMKMAQEDNSQEIGIKRCPRCSTVITHCRRFNNVIKARLNDVVLVKQRVFGNQKEVAVIQAALIRKIRFQSDMKKIFPKMYQFLMELISEPIPVRRDGGEMRYIDKKVIPIYHVRFKTVLF